MQMISTDRMISALNGDAISGKVRWVPTKSIWTLSMLVVAVIAGPLTFSWQAFALLIATTAMTICAGHSVGMHRLLIHRSFTAPKWLERTLVYLGTLVGMAGPFGMIAAHDIRDWAQRQTECHDLYAHRKTFFRDCWWQMHCMVALDHPPEFIIEDEVQNDWFYKLLEKTWMLQQLPWAIALYLLGGWGFVVWGIAVRITLSLHGHWLVGHFAHRSGQQNWAVDGVAVQGFNIPKISILTFGESFHGNHHAYPSSARLAQAKGELDLGWWLILILQWLGLAWNIKLPAQVGEREGLRALPQLNRCYPKKFALLAAWAAATIIGMCEVILLSNGAHTNLTKANFLEIVQLALFIGIPAAIFILISVVPAIRIYSKGAEEDSKKNYGFYLASATILALICSCFTLFLAPITFRFSAPPALVAGGVFGYLNKLAIENYLESRMLITQ